MSVSLTHTFAKGSLVRVSAKFTDPVTGAAIDPDSIACRVKDPAGTVTTKTYVADAELVRDGIGEYHRDVDATAVGTYAYRFESSGAGQAADEGSFRVAQSAF